MDVNDPRHPRWGGMPKAVRELALKHKVGVRHEPGRGVGGKALYTIHEPGEPPESGHMAESASGAMARIRDLVRSRGRK